jgi:hypothetical protein
VSVVHGCTALALQPNFDAENPPVTEDWKRNSVVVQLFLLFCPEVPDLGWPSRAVIATQIPTQQIEASVNDGRIESKSTAGPLNQVRS